MLFFPVLGSWVDRFVKWANNFLVKGPTARDSSPVAFVFLKLNNGCFIYWVDYFLKGP